MTKERDIVKQISEYLNNLGAYSIKVHGTGYSRVGTPDILACLKGRFVAFEVKTKTGNLRPLQRETLRLIETAGGIVGLVRSLADVVEIIEGEFYCEC